jgi:hypothetical protein
MRPWVASPVGLDTFGVSVSEAVDRLIGIADDGGIPLLAEKVDEYLLCPVQILILIDEDVIESSALRKPRIVP